ncbi:MAG: hypothetical protein JJU45_03360 [Acidimicrobiia bacterium]|nr:hypothetical protein [Acidimicrobiia bacterium]
MAAALVLTTVAACSSAYDGPGVDHPFVGRSVEDIRPCDAPNCGIMGYNDGTIDGEILRVTRDLSGEEIFSDLACVGGAGRTDLTVDGDTIVAAVKESC